MTEIPEHLMQRAKRARESVSGGKSHAEGIFTPPPGGTFTGDSNQEQEDPVNELREIAFAIEKALEEMPEGDLLNFNIRSHEGMIKVNLEMSFGTVGSLLVNALKKL